MLPFQSSPKRNNPPAHRAVIQRLIDTIQQAVVIDARRLELLLAALLARGHVLLEDVPGIGKTLVAKALAQSVQASFKRIQCTPDLLPSDVTGSAIFNQREQRFEFIPGPIFANVVLVDEINRASPRTQSSLLESMAEGQVTSDGFTHSLPQPFFIIATQNPVEMAGTYPLPEAQLDRFLVALSLGYPAFEDEVNILQREEHASPLDQLQPAVALAEILALQAAAWQVDVARPVQEYIVRLAGATRTHPDVVYGVSPRGTVAVQRCAQALAFIRDRTFVTPDDVKAVAPAVMGHRFLTRDQRAETARAILGSLLAELPVPLG
ncbi:MAG: MoxR family ATPase [Ardenticatenaceae bacterium]|nr:MoxR family ATPase [Anaerolineales bacterium]MCB8918505.1 MoxR family ATPase [Ardenticatenaceae bacterium]